MSNTHISRLRQERERRGWSRQYVAEQINVDVVTVGRWERGERLPHPFYRQKLCDLFAMNAEALGLFPVSSQGHDEEMTNFDCLSTKEGFIDGSKPQGDVHASDNTVYTINEDTDSSRSTFTRQEETPKRKTSRLPGYLSRLTHLSRWGLSVILMIVLLAAGIGFAIRSYIPSRPAVSALHLIYNNRTVINKTCTRGNKGPIVSPKEVTNGCRVRVWLYPNGHDTTHGYCISPETSTGTLHGNWGYFVVSKTSSICSGLRTNTGSPTLLIVLAP